MFRPAADAPASIDDTAFSQPAIFTLEVAAAHALMDAGLEVAAVAGHSIGELAAACVAGVLSVEDGAVLAALRGRAMGSLPRGDGAMAAVRCSATAAAAAIDAAGVSDACVAAVNGPMSVTLSGPLPESVTTTWTINGAAPPGPSLCFSSIVTLEIGCKTASKLDFSMSMFVRACVRVCASDSARNGQKISLGCKCGL